MITILSNLLKNLGFTISYLGSQFWTRYMNKKNRSKNVFLQLIVINIHFFIISFCVRKKFELFTKFK